MARDLTTGMTAQVTAGAWRPALMVSIGFLSATSYLWSGIGTISWNGQDWLGVGDLGKISDFSETVALQANGFSLELSGIDNALVADSLTEIRQGRPVNVYLGALTAAGTLVDSPALLYSGIVDQPTTVTDTIRSSIQIKVENKLLTFQRAMITRLTSEDQKRKYPADTGLDFVPQLADAAWLWGN